MDHHHSRLGHKGKGNKGEKKYLATPVSLNNKEQISLQYASYNSELTEILRSRDVLKFRDFLSAGQRSLPSEMMADLVKLETMLHQLTLSMPELSDLHPSSRAWLGSYTILKLDGRSLMEASQISAEQKKAEYEAEARLRDGEVESQEISSIPKRRTIFLNIPPSNLEQN